MLFMRWKMNSEGKIISKNLTATLGPVCYTHKKVYISSMITTSSINRLNPMERHIQGFPLIYKALRAVSYEEIFCIHGDVDVLPWQN